MSKEQIISDYIDDLINEKSPRARKRQTEWDDETIDLFETIRAVKRTYTTEKNRKSSIPFPWRKYVAIGVAAVIFFVLTIAIEPLLKPNSGNIVHAVVKAYGQLNTYKGQVVLESHQDGKIDFQETVDIFYQRPWKYHATHYFNGNKLEKVSDGDKVITIYPNLVEIDYLYPDDQLWRYHIGSVVWELEKATKVRNIGMEKVINRDAYLVEYQIGLDNNIHRMWVDTETNLPLKRELNFSEDRKIVIEFKSLEANLNLESSIFRPSIPEDRNIKEWNQLTTFSYALKEWPVLEGLDKQIIKDMQLNKVGIDGEFIVLRYQGANAEERLDITISSKPETIKYLGKEGKGYVQIKNNVVRNGVRLNVAQWVTDDFQIFIYTNRDNNELSQMLSPLVSEGTEIYP